MTGKSSCQQNLLDDKISIRLGQLAADTEFVISDYAALFLNGTFGWPAFMYMNLPEGGPGFPDQGLGWFGRLAFEPQDRNFIEFYFDTGLTYKGIIPTRDGDTLGVAFAYAHLSSGAQQAEIDEGSVGVGAEMALEVTYQAQITKWLSIQPDLQVIINPGGNQNLDNALVIGGRVSITF